MLKEYETEFIRISEEAKEIDELIGELTDRRLALASESFEVVGCSDEEIDDMQSKVAENLAVNEAKLDGYRIYMFGAGERPVELWTYEELRNEIDSWD